MTTRERLARRHELVHERRRGVVEQLAVVDAQHEPAPGRALAPARARACASSSAPPGSSAAGSSGANAPSGIEAAERVARTHSTAQPARSAAPRLGASRVLPTPAGPDHHDAAGRAARQRLGDERELGSAPASGHAHARSLIDRAPVE